jgi:glycosyltransferase involved in cell wall biosynthesis
MCLAGAESSRFPGGGAIVKVVMTSDYYAPHVGGGVERVVEEVAQRLVAGGHSVRVITFNPNGCPPVETVAGVEVVRLPAINLQPILGVPAAVNATLWIRKYLEDADVIHLNNLFFLLSALTIAARPDAPIVTTMHLGALDRLTGLTGTFARLYERTMGRLILERSAAVSAVSPAVARHAAELGYRGSVELVPNAVDVNRFRPPPDMTGPNGHAPSVLFLGRFSRNKGPQFLVDAIPSILERVPSATFRFVGSGPMREHMERRIREMGLNGRARLQGHVADVVPVLQSADVVVRPSLTEGMPLAVMEAMACGRTIVASRVSGTEDVIRDGETGILVEPGSVGALREGVVRVLADHDRALRIGRKAREWAEKQMTWDSITQQYLGLYEEVAS